MEGWTEELIHAARNSNPGNEKLALVASDLAMSSAGNTKAPTNISASDIGLDDGAGRVVGLGGGSARLSLERILEAKSSYNSIRPFAAKLKHIESRTCKISYQVPGGAIYGTGFLVGANKVFNESPCD